jgi:lysophospholipase L1-like esterase
MRLRPVVGSLLLVALSLSVSLAASEALLRLLGHHGEPISRISNIYLVDDEVLDWRYVPNSEVKIGRVVYRYNRAGFRDKDHLLQKPAGIYRVVVLGDSVTEGYDVEWKDVFAQVLQTRLGNRYEVINIAAGGLNTPQEIHLFERVGSRYSPDLVVLNFVLNDVDFYTKFAPAQLAAERGDSRIAMFNLPIPPRVKRLLKSSALIYFVKDRIQSFRESLLGTEGTSNYYERIWASEENRRKVTNGFTRLAELRRKDHFAVLVMIWPLITDYRSYRFGWIHTWVAREATMVGFDVIDLLPQLSSVPYRTLQASAEDSVHPNALGHRLGAEAFLAWYQSPARRTEVLSSQMPRFSNSSALDAGFVIRLEGGKR